MIYEQKNCRLCNGPLEEILSFGDTYISTFVKTPLDNIGKAPLNLAICPKDGLVQLTHSADRDLLYNNYWYRSSLNPTMVSALKEIVEEAVSLVHLDQLSSVIDIGCNDGTMLGLYPDKMIKVGIDPANNLHPKCDIFVNNFFPYPGMPKFEAKIITAIAMFYDLDDPLFFLKAVYDNMHPEGIFICQLSDLASMVTTNAFDAICHEHVIYYSLKAFMELAKQAGFEVFYVSQNKVNGGSIRIYCARYGFPPVHENVQEFLEYEAEYISKEALDQFAIRGAKIAQQVKDFVSGEADNGATISLLGASTKGNTLLQACQIGYPDILEAAEVSQHKFGLYTVYSQIPIVDQAEVLRDPPDYFLVLPWHFIDFFKSRFKKYLRQGGKLIVPMPQPKVISVEGEYLI